ncbi:unnamed protein product [Brugia timori]|uniref:Uncharacterized protein n=1 Tax=Brugia timori TaxID=42155 RepID=A0A3P7TXJ0_9BILA|nr:unnamed protein product [Brugia timori]
MYFLLPFVSCFADFSFSRSEVSAEQLTPSIDLLQHCGHFCAVILDDRQMVSLRRVCLL